MLRVVLDGLAVTTVFLVLSALLHWGEPLDPARYVVAVALGVGHALIYGRRRARAAAAARAADGTPAAPAGSVP